MRKIISILCAICFMVGITTNVFATEISCDGTATTTITYTVPSQFCVYIPETIDLTGGSYTFTASLMDIAETEQVVVSITNEGHGTATVAIYDNQQSGYVSNNAPVAVFTKGCLTSTKSITLESIATSGAGTYSGIAEFSIALQQ